MAGLSDSRGIKESLQMQVRGHEVAIAELSGLRSSRSVYQKNGNIYFKTAVEKANSIEQKQLTSAKAKLEKLSS
ncbi:hypothetical protein MLD38_025751 [Melastoma candidum]|uniref:Uncharacterized protein n=1 Tax=Melastoma candidum TaxID=119954 RepID=A0ACB9P1I7_9MYRT|nr:hypothetical protein MLD38_025751 [Melastoma candidum]